MGINVSCFKTHTGSDAKGSSNSSYTLVKEASNEFIQPTEEKIETVRNKHNALQGILRLRFSKDCLKNRLSCEKKKKKIFNRKISRLNKFLYWQKVENRHDFNQLVRYFHSPLKEKAPENTDNTSSENEDQEILKTASGYDNERFQLSFDGFPMSMSVGEQPGQSGLIKVSKLENFQTGDSMKATGGDLTADLSEEDSGISYFTNNSLTQNSKVSEFYKQEKILSKSISTPWLRRHFRSKGLRRKAKTLFTKFSMQSNHPLKGILEQRDKLRNISERFHNLRTLKKIIFESTFEGYTNIDYKPKTMKNLPSGNGRNSISNYLPNRECANVISSPPLYKNSESIKTKEVESSKFSEHLREVIQKTQHCWSEIQECEMFIEEVKSDLHKRILRLKQEKESLTRQIIDLCEIQCVLDKAPKEI